jgi:nitrogen fixation protein FixH
MMQFAAHHPRKAWIPWLYVLAFIPVFAINVLLIRVALSSSTGLVTDRAFDTGQSYNAVIAAGTRQAALGWHVATDIQPASLPGEPHRITLLVEMRDANGQPLSGLTLGGSIVSPVDPQPDIPVVLAENAGGRYRQKIVLPRAGQWELRLIAANGESQFVIQQRLTAP